MLTVISFRGEDMARVSIKVVYQNEIFMQAGIKKKEQISEDQIKFLNKNKNKGFLSVSWEKSATKNLLKYKVSGMTALSEYVKQNMPQDKYFGLIRQIQKIMEFASDNKLDYNHLVLADPKNVYYDAEKKKVYVAFLPVISREYKCANVVKFLAKLHKYANISVTDQGVMKRYTFFLEDYLKTKKSSVLTHNHLYNLLHDVLEVSPATPSQILAEENAEKPAEGNMTASVADESDHTIVVSAGQKTECAAYLKDENNREIPINHFPFTIGRKADNDLALTDKGTVSKLHAVITYENDTFYIEDKDSSNGTFLNDFAENGQRVIKEKLSSGDVIYIYNIPYVFTVNSSDNATVVVGEAAQRKKSDNKSNKTKSIAYLVNASSNEKVPIYVYPFTCSEISGVVIGRENGRDRHSIFIENISCSSLSIEGSDIAEGSRETIFSGCNFQYHGIPFTFFEEN